MILTCAETELLTRLYKQQLNSLDNEACHAHLRCVPFDLSLRLQTDKSLDYFVTKSRSTDDSRLDRYAPLGLRLAVSELDEKHLGLFSFRTRDGIEKVHVTLTHTSHTLLSHTLIHSYTQHTSHTLLSHTHSHTLTLPHSHTHTRCCLQ